MQRRIWRLGLGTMTIFSRNRVVEIDHKVSRSFQILLLRHLVFHPPRTGMTRRVDHQSLNLREVFQAPRLTPLALSMIRTIWASVLQEKRNVLGEVSLVIGWGIVLLDKVKEVVMVDLSLQLQQHQQVAQLSRVTHLVQVAVSAKTSCMFFRLARIRMVLLM